MAPSGGRINNGKVNVPLEKRKGLWVLTAKSANQAAHGRALATTGEESLHAALGNIRGKKLEDAAAQAGLKVPDVMRSAEGCSTCTEAKATKQPKAGTSPRGVYSVERFMRTAKEMITAMLKGSALPHEYWAHAARHAACIIMETTKVQGKTAWERLTGREPTLPTSRVFGQSITVAIPGTLLGQRWDRVGWIVELGDGKVIETREVSKTKTSIGDSDISGEWRRTDSPAPQSDTVDLPSSSLNNDDVDFDDGSVGDEGDEGNSEEQDGTQEYVPSEANVHRPPPSQDIATQPTATSAPPRTRPSYTYEVRTPETQRNAIEGEILPTRTRSGRTGNNGEANWLNWQGPEAPPRIFCSHGARDDQPR
ncbi:hypothetical protein JCM24511_08167 [Saitozyma sp. JCM 24511]|nr:hypothetical protein JCM24511_08167 [Saitozyma sp. JCM 24511]